VLRYTPFFGKVKELVMNDVIGEVQSLIQVEAVGNEHQSHSYVRGDWHREEETTPMLLAKCCHDLDIIQWIVDKPCEKVSSFGELSYFIPENAPEGAPLRCIDGGCPVEDTCPYHYKKVYLDAPLTNFMCRTAARGYAKNFFPTREELLEGLKNSNFGTCVFRAGNNVVDHQVVNLQFEGGATANLTMNAFNKGGRYIRIFGTKGELYANASDTDITVYDFATKETKKIEVVKTEESIGGGHGGGDQGILKELYEYLGGNYQGYRVADITTSVKNHIIGFAAERARHNDTVENVAKFSKEYGYDYK
jgi:predicted dehydrogenase